MSRGGLGLIAIVIGSLFYLFAGFWNLLKCRKYFEFALVFVCYFITALFLYFGFTYSWNIQNPDMRIWIFAPFLVLSLVWLLSGFFVRTYVLEVIGKIDYSSQTYYSKKPKPKPKIKIRFVGAILSFIGLGIWFYGAFSPFSGNTYICALMFSLICMLFGAIYLMTGRKVSDAD